MFPEGIGMEIGLKWFKELQLELQKTLPNWYY